MNANKNDRRFSDSAPFSARIGAGGEASRYAKTLLLILLCILFTQGMFAQTTIDTTYANSHYRHRLALFRSLPDHKDEIVFLGNSLTEAGEWQELTGSAKVKNRGISGDVTYGIIARLDEVLSSKPAKIFLLTGTNDLKRSIPVDTIANGFARMLALIKTASPKTKIYLQSVFPVNEAMRGEAYKAITNEKVRDLNSRLQTIASKLGVQFIDLYTLLADASGNLRKEYTTDGIHLWPDAYLVWVNHLKKLKCL